MLKIFIKRYDKYELWLFFRFYVEFGVQDFYVIAKSYNFDAEKLIVMKRISIVVLLAVAVVSMANALERIKYGDFQQWIKRNIKESSIIGGASKTLYEIGPTATINGNKAYSNMGGSPWATSNVYAKVAGVSKGSNSVFPDDRGGGNYCAKMTTVFEHVKALGIINMDVLASGSIYLGRMREPVKSPKSPYSKLDMGVAFNKRPKYLCFDYKVYIPAGQPMIYSSGFGSQKVLKGRQNACETFILLQRRWEDEDGNIYAKRVGTGRERYVKSTSGWVNGHKLAVHYGDITKQSFFKSYMGLISKDRPYYARNSKGKMVPVQEVGWDSPNAVPTHMVVMFSAGCGTAYEGTPGQTLWVDNVGLEY